MPVLALLTLTLVLPLAPTATAAQEVGVVEVVDGCGGVDHSGQATDPNTGEPIDAPSALLLAAAMRGVEAGSTVTAFYETPSGDVLEFTGPVGEDGRWEDAAGIFDFGEYRRSGGLLVESEEVDPGDHVPGTIAVGPEDRECSADGLQAVEDEPTETGPATEPGTRSPTEVPLGGTTAPTEVATTPSVEGASRGRGFPWWLLIGIGTGLLLVGLPLWSRERGLTGPPCDPERRAWERAREACGESREKQAEAEERQREAEERQREAQERRRELCEEVPPACSGDAWAEDTGTGERVTNADLWIERQWAEGAWEGYEQAPGPDSAEQTEEAWKDGPPPEFRQQKLEEIEDASARKQDLDREVREAREEAERAAEEAAAAKEAADNDCEKADIARKAYEDCLERHGQGRGRGEDGDGEEEDDGEGGPGVSEEDEGGGQQPPCEDGDERREELAEFDEAISVAPLFDFYPQGMRRAEWGAELQRELGEIGETIAQISDLISIPGAFESPRAFMKEIAERGAKQQHLPTSVWDLMGVPKPPTKPHEFVLGILEFSARFASEAAGAASRMARRHEMWTIEFGYERQKLHMVWWEIHTCRDGGWTDCRRVLEESPPQDAEPTAGRSHEVEGRAAQRELERVLRQLAARVRRDQQRVEAFRDRFDEGPC